MAGNEEQEIQTHQEAADCLFQWDEASQLYYHARSGFYHDPTAGWYYSSKDSLYYTFKDGAYVLLESEKCEDPAAGELTGGHATDDLTGNLPPPSEWLEETLVNLYLTGYSDIATTSHGTMKTFETTVSANNDTNDKPPDESCPEVSGYQDDMVEEIEEGEWIPDNEQERPESSGREFHEDALWDEENWRAQYGQVVQTREEGFPSFPLIDLWDWSMVSQAAGKKKRKVARLIGRLVKRSVRLHPSVPAGGGVLRTAAICDVHLDLVRVVSGQVYKLRNPSARYLTSLSTYDSSNPTKDWGFPDLLVNICKAPPLENEVSHGSETPEEASCTTPIGPLPVKEKKEHIYRDRAAERRILYGGFGIGPGQKVSASEDRGGDAPTSESFNTETAAVEAMHMSFGAGSYARRILEGMGWKEGETLGNNTRGLKEPLQAVGNKGSAGLGWNSHNRF